MGEAILVVEDDRDANLAVVEVLSNAGYSPRGVLNAADARLSAREHWDAVLLDLRLPDGDGLNLYGELFAQRLETPVVLMTGHGTIPHAVAALKLGVHDYLTKPFDTAMLLDVLGTALAPKRARRALECRGPDVLLGVSRATEELRALVHRLAASETSTVLLTGESGTGKDLVARAIHYASRRADRPFMTITCTAIAEQLFESELFGHEKGAFTNAMARKLGLLELAHGGTVFLDEVGDLALSLQAKLLRFLQERTFKRVGGIDDITVDVRVVAATHQPLAARIAAGTFRADLYHRLKVIEVTLPALRDRIDDVSCLASSFASILGQALGRPIEGFTPAALARLHGYSWPGNVRELRNVIERAIVLGRGKIIDVEDLPRELAESAPVGAEPAAPPLLPTEGVEIEAVERRLIAEALRRAGGNKTVAARLLGLSRDQVRYRVQKYGLEPG